MEHAHFSNEILQVKTSDHQTPWVPKIGNQPAIDALQQPRTLFQVTVDPKHGMGEAGLAKALQVAETACCLVCSN